MVPAPKAVIAVWTSFMVLAWLVTIVSEPDTFISRRASVYGATAFFGLLGACWCHVLYPVYRGPAAAEISQVPVFVAYIVVSLLWAFIFQGNVPDSLARDPSYPFVGFLPTVAGVVWVPFLTLLVASLPFAVVGAYKSRLFHFAESCVTKIAKEVVGETGGYDPEIVRARLPKPEHWRFGRWIQHHIPSLVTYDHAVREWWIIHFEDHPELLGLPPRL